MRRGRNHLKTSRKEASANVEGFKMSENKKDEEQNWVVVIRWDDAPPTIHDLVGTTEGLLSAVWNEVGARLKFAIRARDQDPRITYAFHETMVECVSKFHVPISIPRLAYVSNREWKLFSDLVAASSLTKTDGENWKSIQVVAQVIFGELEASAMKDMVITPNNPDNSDIVSILLEKIILCVECR